YLTEAANTVGAQLAGAVPGEGGQHAGQMLSGGLKAALLLNTEPVFDSAAGSAAAAALDAAAMVVTLSPFKANMEFSDVLLPIAPFTETSGSFVNAEGRLQGFHAVVKPAGEARPAWKVLRVLANLLDLPGFAQESSRDALALVDLAQAENGTLVAVDKLGNQTSAAIDLAPADGEPCVASIYQLDALVRRAGSLQLTADARQAAVAGPARAEALA
ncbi:MAG: molybdopterin-dependent oxidoreductase, partial [Rhodoferax sp.]|nr:molybdopterin-dependent oxidoreductase [Rhodoferax sp.]MCB2028916.1 molybdopterin-dependent oxidoreductase [Rhodoferax sp.]MCB2044145.1 molybdopterin-dependent oxidoreductase [Rhodoferax sp.]